MSYPFLNTIYSLCWVLPSMRNQIKNNMLSSVRRGAPKRDNIQMWLPGFFMGSNHMSKSVLAPILQL